MKKILKGITFFFIISFILVFIAGSIAATILINKAYEDLPDVSSLVEEYTPVIPTIIYDINGEIIDKIYKQNRDIANIDEIPKYVQYAFLAIEDKKFFKHHGFDVLRLFKTSVTAPLRIITKRRVAGGSTITQQLAKNAFLTNERKMMRKIKEAIITIEIERKYTKDEILEKYLNEIYFGNGAYGIKTASKRFFNKDIKDLTLAEASILAGIPNRPTKYSLFRFYPKPNHFAKKRQKLVLFFMKKNNFITEDERTKALSEDLKIIKTKKSHYNAPSFTDIVTNKVFEMYTEKEVYEGGLKIYTTLDLRMQKIAEDTFNNAAYIKQNKGIQGALVTIDSSNGYVNAIVGGKNFKTSNFNRAIFAQRQPGSSFKPFIYYTALKLNYQMNTIIEDSKLKIADWEPSNYSNGFRGNMTIMEGMEKSVNIVAIKLLRKLIIQNIINTARKAGIKADIPYNLTIALGTIALSPFELATAYIPFSNGGFTTKPIFITKIEDRYGNIIFKEKIEKNKVFDSESISLIVHMLKNVVLNGSGKRAYVGIEQGGKTGTTNDSTNAWFSGITPDFVTTLYIGYDDNRPMERATGGGVAAPIWGTYVKRLIDENIYTPSKFEFLENYLKDKKLVYRSIDINNGLLSDKTTVNKRKALFKREALPIEKAGKYKNGLEVILPITPIVVQEKLQEDVVNTEEKMEVDLNNPDNYNDKKIKNEDEEVESKIESFFKDLFN